MSIWKELGEFSKGRSRSDSRVVTVCKRAGITAKWKYLLWKKQIFSNVCWFISKADYGSPHLEARRLPVMFFSLSSVFLQGINGSVRQVSERLKTAYFIQASTGIKWKRNCVSQEKIKFWSHLLIISIYLFLLSFLALTNSNAISYRCEGRHPDS